MGLGGGDNFVMACSGSSGAGSPKSTGSTAGAGVVTAGAGGAIGGGTGMGKAAVEAGIGSAEAGSAGGGMPARAPVGSALLSASRSCCCA